MVRMNISYVVRTKRPLSPQNHTRKPIEWWSYLNYPCSLRGTTATSNSIKLSFHTSYWNRIQNYKRKFSWVGGKKSEFKRTSVKLKGLIVKYGWMQTKDKLQYPYGSLIWNSGLANQSGDFNMSARRRRIWKPKT